MTLIVSTWGNWSRLNHVPRVLALILSTCECDQVFADIINIRFSELNPLGFKMGPTYKNRIYKRKEWDICDTETQSQEGHAMMEAEIKGYVYKPRENKDPQQPPEVSREAQNRCHQEEPPCQCLFFNHWSPESWENTVPIFLSHQICGNLLGQL